MSATTRSDAALGPDDRIDLVEKKARLSALWLFVLLNLIFRDLHEIVKAEFLEEALQGTYNGQEVTEALFLVGGILIEIPIMMTLAAWVLPGRVLRLANLVIAPLFGLLVIFGAPGDLDDYFHASLELLALTLIVWQAWRWGRPGSQPHVPAGRESVAE